MKVGRSTSLRSSWCFSRQILISPKYKYTMKLNLPLVTLDQGGVPKVGAIFSTTKNLCPVMLRRC